MEQRRLARSRGPQDCHELARLCAQAHPAQRRHLDLTHAVDLGDALSDDEWDYFARIVFAEQDGVPVIDYDPDLGKTMPGVEQINSGAAPDLWPAFEALAGLPTAAIRGAHSDLLSPETLNAMSGRIDGLEAVTIPDRGHTLFLTEQPAIDAIERTLARADQ